MTTAIELAEIEEARRKAKAFIDTTWFCDKCHNYHPNDLRGTRGECDRLSYLKNPEQAWRIRWRSLKPPTPATGGEG